MLAAIVVIAAGTVAGCTHLQSQKRTFPERTPPVSTSNASPAPSEHAALPAATVAPAPSYAGTPASENAPRLAIIIDDCGQWLTTERALIALPVPLTLSVLPDVRYTAQIAKEASDAGKGVMLHLPMEPISGINAGPGEITTSMSDTQIEAQVSSDLDQVPLAMGVNCHEGSRATADERVMRDVAAAMVKHGNLFFIDSLTGPNSVAQQTAAGAGLPTASRDVFLDNQADAASVEAQLRVAAQVAKAHGSAIAIGHPRPGTLAALQAMLPELQRDGIQFVLAQDLVKR